jgi:DNA-binding transcriptional ArsR family regulator
MDFVRTLKALADPIRLRVLAAVAEEELTVGEVQEVVESVQSSVSRNLAILRDAGFVQDRKEGTNVYFSVRQDMPEPAASFQVVAGTFGYTETKDRARIEDRAPVASLTGYLNRWPVTGSVFARAILTTGHLARHRKAAASQSYPCRRRMQPGA